MKSKLISIGILLFVFLICRGQTSIESCYEKAKNNYPLIRQYDLIEKTKKYNLSNASKGYLPQISFSAKATYQSEVTEIPIDIPGVKGLNKDQYGIGLDVSQTLWDGGIIHSQRNIIKTQTEMNEKELEVSLYKLNERVNQLYFGILLYDAMLKQNQVFLNELQRNYDLVFAYIQNGIANQADLAAVKIEQLKALQQQTQLQYNRNTYLKVLSTLIGEDMNENAFLIKPEINFSSEKNIFRPELALYDVQHKNQEAMRTQINAAIMPKLGLFITGGYGRPGLNMLENEFSAYYIGGVRLTWNLSNLYTRRNDLKNVQSNQNSINLQREVFLFNTQMDMDMKNNDIRKLEEMLKADDEIISLRNSVKRSAESKLADGIISAIDLMKEVNAEQMAKQDKIIHDIELLQAVYNLKYLTNN